MVVLFNAIGRDVVQAIIQPVKVSLWQSLRHNFPTTCSMITGATETERVACEILSNNIQGQASKAGSEIKFRRPRL